MLGVKVDLLIMTLSLTEKKVSKVHKQYLELLQKTQVSILELTKLIGLLSSTIQAVLPAQINFRYLQIQLIHALQTQGPCCEKVIPNRNSKEELQCWIQNFKIFNCRYLIQSHSQVLIQTDASRKGWGAGCQGISIRGQWSKEERLLHINVLEMKVVNLALLRNLAVSLATPDHNYCSVPPKFFECGSRLAVSKQQGLIRMETLSKSISGSLPEEGNTKSRFV